MKVFVELARFAATASGSQMRERVRALEDMGATGVSLWDHIFISWGASRLDAPMRPADPLTTLAVVAGLSDRLEVQTVVVNSQWIHPALLLRQFAQLAVLIGGERVTAGLGAGWNADEFDALGLAMAPFAMRMDRLEETLHIARQLFDEGSANFSGRYVTVRDLPLSPLPTTPPRLLVGGGSDRVMEMAGRYADVLDLQADPKHGTLAGKTMVDRHLGDVQRRALTSVDDLAGRVELVRSASRAAGRAEGAVSMSVQIEYIAYGSKHEVSRAEEEICARWGHIPTQSLARNPYVLLGEPQQIAEALIERRELFGLNQISLKEAEDISAAPFDPFRFCHEVLPLLT